MEISSAEVRSMYKKTEKLQGLDMYVNLHFDQLSKEDQAKYTLAARTYISELEKIVENIKGHNGDKTIMCHNIIFDRTKVFDPYSYKFLRDCPLFVTNYIYGPIETGWLGLRVRELNKYIQIYIPDPHATMSKDEAIEQAIDDAQEYIKEEMRKRNEWEEIRGIF